MNLEKKSDQMAFEASLAEGDTKQLLESDDYEDMMSDIKRAR